MTVIKYLKCIGDALRTNSLLIVTNKLRASSFDAVCLENQLICPDAVTCPLYSFKSLNLSTRLSLSLPLPTHPQTMAYYDRRYQSSILDSFTLSPLPYPVILILLMVFFFLGVSSYFTYEDFMEEVEEQMSWILLAVPLVLILLIQWLSSIDTFDGFVGFFYPNQHNRRINYGISNDGGSSPWGVAALVVLVLILASFHSTFQDMWKP
jgi:hypothetical protein